MFQKMTTGGLVLNVSSVFGQKPLPPSQARVKETSWRKSILSRANILICEFRPPELSRFERGKGLRTRIRDKNLANI